MFPFPSAATIPRSSAPRRGEHGLPMPFASDPARKMLDPLWSPSQVPALLTESCCQRAHRLVFDDGPCMLLLEARRTLCGVARGARRKSTPIHIPDPRHRQMRSHFRPVA